MSVDRVAITLDIDWAPDHVIDDVAARLIAAGVRATWFVTHASPAVDRLRLHPGLFELGIHPNFLAGSTQGNTPAEILAHCMRLVPDAQSMRTHCLIQSTPLYFDVAEHTPIRNDVSLYLPGHPGLQATTFELPGGTLTRLPFWWEDDYEMLRRVPDWDLVSRTEPGDGLRILNFHPVHIALNSATLDPYRALKSRVQWLRSATPSVIGELSQTACPGTGTAFDAMLSWLSTRGGGSTIAMLADVHTAADEARDLVAVA